MKFIAGVSYRIERHIYENGWFYALKIIFAWYLKPERVIIYRMILFFQKNNIYFISIFVDIKRPDKSRVYITRILLDIAF